ncbi:hypothetical protein ES707_06398 [subsurface metagenome]
MKKLILVILVAAVLLGGCSSMRGRGRGPVEAFMLLAVNNPGLAEDVAGIINERGEPKSVELVLPPGTDKRGLVAFLSLNSEATVTIISSGSRVVQDNGRTANDFAVPLLYSIEVAGDEEPWQYRVTARDADTDARLAAIAFPEGHVLQPGFNPAVKDYSVKVPYASRIVKIAAKGQSRYLKSLSIGTVESGGAAAVAGVDFTSGEELDFTITTLAEDGVSSEQYTITLIRGAPDKNAALASLEIAGGLISPLFSPDRLIYLAQVPFSTKEVTVETVSQSQFATVAIARSAEAGQTQPGGSAIEYQQLTENQKRGILEFATGDRLPLLVSVTAQDGSVLEYQVEIIRAAPDSNNLLASLAVTDGSLSPSFAAQRSDYGAIVPYAAKEVFISARSQSAVARVALEPGSDLDAATRSSFSYRGDPASVQGAVIDFAGIERLSVLVRVIAENGSVQSYSLKIRRAAPDSNTNLASLTALQGVLRPAFTPRTATYSVSLPASVGSAQLSLRAASSVATVGVVDQPSIAAAVSQDLSVAVNPGEARVVSFVVTAEDGSQRLFRIEVRRAGVPAVQPTEAQPTTVQPPAVQPTEVQPAEVQPAEVQPTAVQPAEAQPLLSGRIAVELKNLRLETREAAALAANKEEIGTIATITARIYRTDTVLLQDNIPVKVRSQGKTWALTMAYHSGSITLQSGRLIEIELAIPTSGGRYLHYTEALQAATDLTLQPSFMLFGENPRVGWPAPGTPVSVDGYVSLLPPGKGGAKAEVGEEEFERNSKGEYGIGVDITDAASGRLLGRDTVWTRPGLARGRVFGFSRQMELPEGASVRYLLQAKAKNGRVWQADGIAEVWTTRLNYAGGFNPAVMVMNGH